MIGFQEAKSRVYDALAPDWNLGTLVIEEEGATDGQVWLVRAGAAEAEVDPDFVMMDGPVWLVDRESGKVEEFFPGVPGSPEWDRLEAMTEVDALGEPIPPEVLQGRERELEAEDLGEDGLGDDFDLLTASGASKTALLAAAVEASHRMHGVPAVLADGAALAWAETLTPEQASEMLYPDAPEAFIEHQAKVVVAAALRRRVYE